MQPSLVASLYIDWVCQLTFSKLRFNVGACAIVRKNIKPELREEFGPKAPPFLLLWLETAGTLSTKMHEHISIVMPKDCHQGAASPGYFRHHSE